MKQMTTLLVFLILTSCQNKQKETVALTKPKVATETYIVCGDLWTIYDTKPKEVQFIDVKQ
jgi:hypothetical protein